MWFRCCEGCDARRAYEIAHQYQEGNILFCAALFFNLERKDISFSFPLFSYYWVHAIFRLMSEKCGRPNLLRMVMQCLWPQELQGTMGVVVPQFSWPKCVVKFLKLRNPEFVYSSGIDKINVIWSNCEHMISTACVCSIVWSLFPTGKVDGIIHRCFRILEVMMMNLMVPSLPSILLLLVLDQKLRHGMWDGSGMCVSSGYKLM